MSSLASLDTKYLALGQRCLQGNVPAIVAGDSHAKRLWQCEVRRADDSNVVVERVNGVGGQTLASFDQQLRQLVECPYPIVILCIGGNDIDRPNLSEVSMGFFVEKIFSAIYILENNGKSVYIVSVIGRFTTRQCDPTSFMRILRAVNKKLQRHLPTRLIRLPFSLSDEVFERQFRRFGNVNHLTQNPVQLRHERVHLKPEYYCRLMEKILVYVHWDLVGSRMRPSTFLPKLDELIIFWKSGEAALAEAAATAN